MAKGSLIRLKMRVPGRTMSYDHYGLGTSNVESIHIM